MKRLILIGATLAVIIATTFVYVPRAGIAPQTVSITATTSGTVIDAMRALAPTGAVTFAGRDYPGLGFFVDSINGQENTDGRYWILYVNGVLATAGASMVTIQAGDTIEWKYEKGF